jgi:hypothetical protein
MEFMAALFRLLVNPIIGQYRLNLLQNKSQLYYIILAGIVLQYIRCSSIVLHHNTTTLLPDFRLMADCIRRWLVVVLWGVECEVDESGGNSEEGRV